MSEEKPVWEGRMRKTESKAFIYELPAMGLALGAGAVLAVIYAYVINRFQLFLKPNLPLFIMIGLALIGLCFIFWGASYYGRRITVFQDRIRFQMAFGRRDVPVNMISSLTALSIPETKKTFFSLRYVNLTPTVEGAVMLKRLKGRVWVFSPENAEEFISAVKGIMANQNQEVPVSVENPIKE